MKAVHSIIGIGMCALVSLIGSNAAFAQAAPAAPAAAPAGTVQERLTALEEKTETPGLWKTAGFQVSGTVLASYTQNFGNPYTNNNQLRVFDTAANSFQANMVQLVFERPANAEGTGADRVGFRARLNFGADARFSRARTNFQARNDQTELDMQEMYAEYIAPIGNGLKIQFGKINTLIGYEVINAWENPNFSRTMMFGLSQAFTETGIRFNYTFNKMVAASVGLVNGWDNIEDNNRGKTITYLLAITPHDRFGVNFFGSYGSEMGNGNNNGTSAQVGVCQNGTAGCDPSGKRLVMGAIITMKPIDTTTIILEPYYGNESHAGAVVGGFNTFGGNQTPINSSSGNARWNGFVAYLIHDLNDQTQPNAFSLRGRGEIWEDAGGSRACGGNSNFTGGANTCAGTDPTTNVGTIANNPFVPGNGLTAWETTWTLQWKPVPALQTRVEYRYDHADHNVYLVGTRAANNQNTLGFSVAYMF
jgi:hypothetical protein